MSNYPDDIDNYKNDPRSPLYEEPIQWCEHCEQIIDEDGLCGCEEIIEGEEP
jgi:hypothetical protein